MKLVTTAKKFGSTVKATAAALLFAPAFSFAANPVLDAVDFTEVAAWVAGIGVVIIGIRMAFKGVDLGKRAVSKV